MSTVELKNLSRDWIQDIKANAHMQRYDASEANERLSMMCDWALAYWDRAKAGSIADEDEYFRNLKST